MIRYSCDGCGTKMERSELRYVVKIDARAAYDTLEITLADLFRNHESELRALVEELAHRDPSEIEDEIFKQFELDLCPSCYRSYIKDPLRFRPGYPVSTDPGFDVDAFLRRLTGNDEESEGE